MSDPTRYNPADYAMEADREGEYVKYADYVQAARERDAALSTLDDGCAHRSRVMSQRDALLVEVTWLREALVRIRSLIPTHAFSNELEIDATAKAALAPQPAKESK